MNQVVCVHISFILEQIFSENLLFPRPSMQTQVADSYERLFKHLYKECADKKYLRCFFSSHRSIIRNVKDKIAYKHL